MDQCYIAFVPLLGTIVVDGWGVGVGLLQETGLHDGLYQLSVVVYYALKQLLIGLVNHV